MHPASTGSLALATAVPCAPLRREIGYAGAMPPTPTNRPAPEPRVRGALGQVMAAVQEFWWGYWQAPPGC